MKSYYQELNDTDKATYRKKCSSIGFADPYLLEKKDLSKDQASWPSIAHGDIVIYLTFSENPMCTHKDMKAYKELEAYKQFISECVQDVSVGYIDDIAVILGKVSEKSWRNPLSVYHMAMVISWHERAFPNLALYKRNSLFTTGFPSQMASNVDLWRFLCS